MDILVRAGKLAAQVALEDAVQFFHIFLLESPWVLKAEAARGRYRADFLSRLLSYPFFGRAIVTESGVDLEMHRTERVSTAATSIVALHPTHHASRLWIIFVLVVVILAKERIEELFENTFPAAALLAQDNRKVALSEKMQMPGAVSPLARHDATATHTFICNVEQPHPKQAAQLLPKVYPAPPPAIANCGS